jgi:lactobin A/cerein 7B family class IIb bacteriocin
LDTTFDTLAAIGTELTDEQLDDAVGGIWPVLAAAYFAFGVGFFAGVASTA